MDKEKTLIVYYSRTGNTRKLAENLREKLNCQIEEIVDVKSRKGIFGFVKSGMDAALKRDTTIKTSSIDLSQYDLVILGTPVWASNMTPAIRTFIKMSKGKIKNVAFFCTQMSSGKDNTFADMRELVEKEPVSSLYINSKGETREDNEIRIQTFIEDIINFKI